jgi:hypothetical protein
MLGYFPGHDLYVNGNAGTLGFKSGALSINTSISVNYPIRNIKAPLLANGAGLLDIDSADNTKINYRSIVPGGIYLLRKHPRTDGLVISVSGQTDLGNIKYAQESNIFDFGFLNASSAKITNVVVSAANEVTGLDVLMSKTRDPFSASQDLTFTDTYDRYLGYDEFSIQIDTTTDASEGTGTVDIVLDGENTA